MGTCRPHVDYDCTGWLGVSWLASKTSHSRSSSVASWGPTNSIPCHQSPPASHSGNSHRNNCRLFKLLTSSEACLMMNEDISWSHSSLCASNSTSTRSNLLSRGLARATFTLRDCRKESTAGIDALWNFHYREIYLVGVVLAFGVSCCQDCALGVQFTHQTSL